MNRRRQAALVGALALSGAVGATAFAMPASAATPAKAGTAPAATAAAAPYNGACGSGYTVIDQINIGTQGTVYLTWSERTGENCVVTVRTKPGAAVYMHAKVFQTAHTEVSASDSGAYTTYAGPVYIPGRGECISWRGQIGDEYVNGSGHCG